MAGNRAIANVIFHENTTVPSDGLEYMITADANTMNIDFIGSGTFSAIVEGKVYHESDFDEIMVVNLKTYDMTTQPNTFDTYKCDITAWSYVRVRLIAVSGDITVVGKLVG